MTRRMIQPTKAWFRARVAELEAALKSQAAAHLLALADKGMNDRVDADLRVAAEAENGRTLAWYAAGIAGVFGLIVGSLWT